MPPTPDVSSHGTGVAPGVLRFQAGAVDSFFAEKAALMAFLDLRLCRNRAFLADVTALEETGHLLPLVSQYVQVMMADCLTEGERATARFAAASERLIGDATGLFRAALWETGSRAPRQLAGT